MHCTSCSMVIEGELEDQLGVKAACNYAKQTAEVEFDEKSVSEKQIIKVIRDRGYEVV